MNEQQQLISDSLNRLLTDLCTPNVVDAAESGQWAANLWDTLTETGLTLAGVDEAHGGAGGDPEDSLLILQIAARYAAPVPLAEHFIAGTLLAEAGGTLGEGPATIAQGTFSLDGNKLTGEAHQVPFARWCSQVLIVAEAGDSFKLCLLPVAAVELSEAMSIAGEPRDTITVNTALADGQVFDADAGTGDRMHMMAAACRSVMMAGAIEKILEMSVEYAQERVQFGRSISKFQAIQHQLAVLAGEAAASMRASHAVMEAFQSLDEIEIAIGKARIGEAVSVATDIAHGVHGAMGYTLEHSLNHRTRRLWCWRDEYGAERFWQIKAGRAFLEAGADGLWNAITSRN